MRIVTWLVLGAFPAIALGQGTSADGRRTDLAAFRRDFFTMDSSYSAANRATAVSRLARLEADAPGLTAVQFELELARIVALADNGHTNSPATLRSRRYFAVPERSLHATVAVPPDGRHFRTGVRRRDHRQRESGLEGQRLSEADGRAATECQQ